MYVEGILPQCVQITKVRVLNRSIGGSSRVGVVWVRELGVLGGTGAVTAARGR